MLFDLVQRLGLHQNSLWLHLRSVREHGQGQRSNKRVFEQKEWSHVSSVIFLTELRLNQILETEAPNWWTSCGQHGLGQIWHLPYRHQTAQWPETFKVSEKHGANITMCVTISGDIVLGHRPCMGSYNAILFKAFLDKLTLVCRAVGVTYDIVWECRTYSFPQPD